MKQDCHTCRWRLDWDDKAGGDVITNGEQSVSLYDTHHSVRAMVQAALNMVDNADRAARRAHEQFEAVLLYAYADTKERERMGWVKRDSAAAPDMRDAVHSLLAEIDARCEDMRDAGCYEGTLLTAIEEARAALAKAEGR